MKQRLELAPHCDLNFDHLFGPSSSVARRDEGSAQVGRRLGIRYAENVFLKWDFFADCGASSSFARFNGTHPLAVRLALTGSYRLEACTSGGWLVLPTEANGDTYWLPQMPKLRRVDDHGHILEERAVELSGLTASPDGIALVIAIPCDWALDVVAWRVPPGSRGLIDELNSLSTIETKRHFLWGSHTVYRRPADLYLHLIHGHVYENRSSWPKHWKICSENDAHALYTVLRGLEVASSKRIYRLLKEQLLVSVMDRQGDDGGWRHGEWTDRMESHYRLHCSAMHLLMDALDERDDPDVREALRRAAAFLAQQIDKLNAGAWFLHDELEHSESAMREGPFRLLPSRALGKSESNMLVLNSHLDATIAMDRYRQTTGDGLHQELVAQANVATRDVLALRPAEWLYAPLFRAIRLTFLPAARAKALPLPLRALKRLAWQNLIPLLPRIKARFPRMVMPGGYIERELSLRIFASEYLPINLMDLLRYRRRFPWESIDATIAAGLKLVRDSYMFERWPEIKGSEYAVGFWAEALYHACLLYPDAKYREWLAQAVMALEALEVGLPPSLLGANSEAVSTRDQAPTPVLDDDSTRVVNLSRGGRIEVLLINCSNDVAPLHFVRNDPDGLAWTMGTTPQKLDGPPLTVAPAAWLWGRDSASSPEAA